MQIRRRAAAPLLVAALVAACSGSATSATTAPAPSTGAVAAASAAPAASSGSGYDAGGYTRGASSSAATGAGASAATTSGIALATNSLGTILVGADGKTLYVFLADSNGTSACTGACATNWPPLTGALPALGQGLNAADFGSITRGDGTAQVTFHGQPLYYFAGDQAAGDTKGQGLSGKWYVVGADGKPIK